MILDLRPVTVGLMMTLMAVAVSEAQPPSEPGYLGIQLGEPTAADQEHPSVDQNSAIATGVMPESPAARAGVAAGDVLVSLNGEPFEGARGLARSAAQMAPGDKVTLGYLPANSRAATSVSVRQIEIGRNPWVGIDKPSDKPGMHRVTVKQDVAYISGDTNALRTLDFYYPNDAQNVPTLIWIHGGAWSFGDKRQDHALALRFAERGIAVALVNHRVSPERWSDPEGSDEGVTMPAHAEDCAAAIAWVFRHLETLEGADPKRTFVGGHSSGAHLSMLVALDARYLDQHEIESSRIAGVVAIEGAYDIGDYHDTVATYLGAKVARDHLTAVFGEDRVLWNKVSPIHYLDRESTSLLLVKGTERPYQHYAERLADRAAMISRPRVEMFHAKNRVHTNIIRMMHRNEPDALRERVINFINAV